MAYLSKIAFGGLMLLGLRQTAHAEHYTVQYSGEVASIDRGRSYVLVGYGPDGPIMSGSSYNNRSGTLRFSFELTRDTEQVDYVTGRGYFTAGDLSLGYLTADGQSNYIDFFYNSIEDSAPGQGFDRLSLYGEWNGPDYFSIDARGYSSAPVPEPSTLSLMGLAVACGIAARLPRLRRGRPRPPGLPPA